MSAIDDTIQEMSAEIIRLRRQCQDLKRENERLAEFKIAAVKLLERTPFSGSLERVEQWKDEARRAVYAVMEAS